MDKKTYFIGVLLVTAVALLVANILGPQRAVADVAVNNGDYQVATTRIGDGGDALYILDNNSGRMAAFSYDAGSKRLVPRAAKAVEDVFGAGGRTEKNGKR